MSYLSKGDPLSTPLVFCLSNAAYTKFPLPAALSSGVIKIFVCTMGSHLILVLHDIQGLYIPGGVEWQV